MAGEYTLKNGLETDWTLHSDGWKPGVDKDWKKIDWRLAPTVLSIEPTSATVPVSPANGAAYLVENVNQIWVWNAVTVQFDKINLVNPFIFYNVEDARFKKWIASVITDLEAFLGGQVPIGGVIAFQDYDILPLPAGFWWLDGSVINAPGSPIDGQVADDMSGLYPGSYGTVGGGNMPAAAYDSATIGNAGNEINLAHDHDMPHTHPGAAHTHPLSDDGYALIGNDDTTSVCRFQEKNVSSYVAAKYIDTNTGDDGTKTNETATPLGGDTDSGGSGDTGAASSSTTDSALSATTNIQPQTRRLKWIIRVL